MPRLIVVTLFIALTLFVLTSILDIFSNQSGVTETKKTVPAEKEQKENSGLGDLFASAIGESTKLRSEEKNQINFLFLGIGGEEHISGNYLTDTIIVAIFAPESKNAAVISIPRDLLVRSPRNGYFTKINALYPMGIAFIKEKIQEITGLTLDYYAVLDLAGVEKIVDTLGGIYVSRDEDLMDNRFPDDNYGYETYKINEGWRYLNGEEAVKYIRTRHTAGGDFDRMKRQQEVARAIKKKSEGLKSVAGLPKLLSIYKTLKDNLVADLEIGEISRLMELSNGVKEENIIFEQITAGNDGLLVYDRIELAGVPASILKPRSGLEDYSEIKSKMKELIEQLKKK